jgi:hypothetical protein
LTCTALAQPTTVLFSYPLAGALPFPQQFSVTSQSATTEVSGLSLVISQTWIQASLSSATTPAILTVAINPNSMVVGTYTGTVDVTAPSSTALEFDVILTISPATPSISVSLATLIFSAVQDGPSPVTQI